MDAAAKPARQVAQRPRALVQVQVEQGRLLAGLPADLLVHLVPVHQPVDQARVERLPREERPVAEQRRDLRDGSPRPAATAPASCSVTDSARRAAASRAGPVKPDSVNWSGADLYSYRLALSKPMPSFSRASCRKTCSTATPVSPRCPTAEGRYGRSRWPGNRAGCRGRSRRTTRPRPRRASRPAKVADRRRAAPGSWRARFLTRRPSRRGPAPGRRPRPAAGRQAGPVAASAHGEQRGQRIRRRAFRDAVGQVKLEDERPGPALPHVHELRGKPRVCHAASLRGEEHKEVRGT